MAVAHASDALIRIEAQDVDHAGALVQALVGRFDAEDVALDGERMIVEVRPRGDSEAAVVRALGAVEEWLAAAGPDSAVVHVLGRSYRMDAPARSRAVVCGGPLRRARGEYSALVQGGQRADRRAHR